MDQPPPIRIDNLIKDYRDFWGRRTVRAVKGISFQIEPGETFGLIGLNGSGKTTTIKTLLGLLFPSSGSVSVLGAKPTDWRKNGRIGFLPEESYLPPFLNARETLDFYGALYGLPRRERRRRGAELIERVGLADAKRRKLKEYSKGMRRRIGLAQALINRPELLILDEPTSGLDPVGREMALELIAEAKGWGATVLICTHLLEQVSHILDTVGMMHEGWLHGPSPVIDRQVHLDGRQLDLGDYFLETAATTKDES